MARPPFIELGRGAAVERLPILYEDRSVLAIDKPPGWMLVPFNWQRTTRNLAAALASSIAAGDFWASSRNLKFLRHLHRLDADTSGILLFAKSPGAVEPYGALFESRQMEKTYLAVVGGLPNREEWTCRQKLGPDTRRHGLVRVDERGGKPAETHFRVLSRSEKTALLEASPVTGRQHQIRVHLAESRHPVLGDELYGRLADAGKLPPGAREKFPLALRAVHLAYRDPFTGRPVRIEAPAEEFRRAFGFAASGSARPPASATP